MSVRVGELHARLTLDDARFQESIKKAEASVQRLAKVSSTAFAALAGSITTAAVAASNYGDHMVTVSQQTGIAVENVQALAFAAEQGGANMGLLESGLRSFLRRSAAAAAGNEQYLRTFQELGFTQQQVAEGLRDIEGLFLDVADRIAHLSTEAEMANASMNLMSNAGRQLVPFLKMGRTEIENTMQAARDMGLVMSRNAVQDLADFNSEWSAMRQQITAAGRTIVVEFLPTLRTAMDLIGQGASFVSNLSDETKRLIGTIGAGTVGAVGSFAALTTTIWATTRAVQALSATLRLASGPAGWITLAVGAVASLAAGLGLASLHARSARTEIEQFASIADLDIELERVNRQIAEIEERMESLRRTLTTPVIGGPRIRFEATAEGEDGLLDQLEDLRARQEALLEQREYLEELERQQAQILADLMDAIDGVAKSTRTLDDVLDDHQRRLEIHERLTRLLGDSYNEAEERLRAFERTIHDAAESGFAHEESIIAIAEAYREMAEAMQEAEVQTDQMGLTISDLQRIARIAELRMKLGMPMDVDSWHFLGDLPHDATWQAWRILSDIAKELREEFESLEAASEDFSQEAVDILQALVQIDELISRIEDELREDPPVPMVPVTPGALVPFSPMPDVSVHEARLQEFVGQVVQSLRTLSEQVEAGLVPTESALFTLREWQSGIIQLSVPLGGMIELNDEQLRVYNDLTRVYEQWLAALEQTPSRLDEIRAEMERRLGVGMAVERELARALGADFDPMAYEMDVLRSTLQQMAQVTGEITPEMQGYIDQLRRLVIEHEALATTEAAVRAALDGLGRNLGDIGRLVTSSIDFRPGVGFSFDTGSFMIGAIGVAADLLFGASDSLDGSAAAIDRAAQALESASHSWRQALSEGQFHELVTTTPEDQIRELQKARKDAEGQIAIIEKRWLQFWKASAHEAQKSQLQDLIREIDKEVRNLQENWETELQNRIDELLGITTRGLQGAVSGAFSASTAEDFAENIESALEGRVRNAFVTAFLESATMSPLFDQLRDLIREALMDTRIDAGEMEGIRAVMDEIKERSTPLYELLDEFGLLVETTERVNNEFARLVNVPLGFRDLQRMRFQAAPQLVPALVQGSIVTRPTMALIGEAGPEAVIPLSGDGAALGGDIHIHGGIHLPGVTNAREFERELRNLQRRESLRRTSNPAALRRVGR